MVSEPSPPKLVVGQRYALERMLGQGGMGEVWQARHVALKAPVAVKLLQWALTGDAAMSRRFLTEAQITAQLQTRHAVRVYDVGIAEDGRPYLVMELLEGETLQARLLRKHRLEPTDVVHYLSQAARALQRAHDLGIVHRDFKPSNVFLTTDEDVDDVGDVVKVMDFGIAKLLGELEALPPSARTDSVPSDATTSTAFDACSGAATLRTAQPRLDPRGPCGDRPGKQDFGLHNTTRRTLETFGRTFALVGTPLYMAPEQVCNAPDLGPAADIWAFGVVTYQCLVGRTPFEAVDARTVFHRIVHGICPRPSEVLPSLPSAFDDWFARACAVDPKARFDGPMTAAAELSRALGVTTSVRMRSYPSLQRLSTPRSLWPASSDLTGTTSVRRLAIRTPIPSGPDTHALLTEGQAPTSQRLRSTGLWSMVLPLAAASLGLIAWSQRGVRPPPHPPQHPMASISPQPSGDFLPTSSPAPEPALDLTRRIRDADESAATAPSSSGAKKSVSPVVVVHAAPRSAPARSKVAPSTSSLPPETSVNTTTSPSLPSLPQELAPMDASILEAVPPTLPPLGF